MRHVLHSQTLLLLPVRAAGGGERPHDALLVEAVLAGGTLTVCTQCAVRRNLILEDLSPGARIAGAATFLEESLTEGAQALVY